MPSPPNQDAPHAAGYQLIGHCHLGDALTLPRNSQPGNNQTLVFKRFGQGNLAGMISSLEFGNYLNQHHPEEATVGWKYMNFKLDMTPK